MDDLKEYEFVRGNYISIEAKNTTRYDVPNPLHGKKSYEQNHDENI